MNSRYFSSVYSNQRRYPWNVKSSLIQHVRDNFCEQFGDLQLEITAQKAYFGAAVSVVFG